MEKYRSYITAAIVIALIAGGAIYVVLANRSPSEEIALESGGKTKVTPTEKMRVRTAEEQPKIDPSTYMLEIGGLVEKELTLTFDELKKRTAEERFVELPCVEGWTEAGVWKGTRLKPLLEEAGVKESAATVVFTSPGGYTTSLTLEDVDETDPLLAYGVNGDDLPEEQGFPLRLVVPDRLGYKWIKWVTGIELISGTYEGYWESRGYSNEAEVKGR
jgi:DMSO/TMAO reductase YedYZ molybdopterin-dependent catalytic subunit